MMMMILSLSFFHAQSYWNSNYFSHRKITTINVKAASSVPQMEISLSNIWKSRPVTVCLLFSSRYSAVHWEPGCALLGKCKYWMLECLLIHHQHTSNTHFLYPGYQLPFIPGKHLFKNVTSCYDLSVTFNLVRTKKGMAKTQTWHHFRQNSVKTNTYQVGPTVHTDEKMLSAL